VEHVVVVHVADAANGVADDLAEVDASSIGLVVPRFLSWSLGMVISPPTTTMLLFTKVSQATRLLGSTARQASRMASEMVSANLVGMAFADGFVIYEWEPMASTAMYGSACWPSSPPRRDTAREYFNELAGRFGRSYIPGRTWKGLSHLLLELLPPLDIADLGAGEGTLSQLLARSAKSVIAVDNSEKMVAFGRKLIRDHKISNLEYRLGDLEDPPIPSASVDLALFSQALHHAAHPAGAIAAAFRILRPGGRIAILDLLGHTFEEARKLYADHWLGFGEAELHELLEQAGFNDIRVDVVARESRSPNFQTVLALGRKP
jgi:ubiquinone/menaquinone biosynthesis C-methylase UbiE